MDILFQDMPVGIALFDRSLCLVRANATWRDYIARYTESKAADVVPGVSLYTLAPGVKAQIQPLFERVLQGETIRREAFEATSGGIISYWDVVFSPLRANGQIVGIVDITTDATERVKAKHELEQTVQHLEHSRANLASLLENARGFAVYRLLVDPAQPHGARVLMVSPSFSDITGIDQPYDFELWFANIHPGDQPEARAANRHALTANQPYDRTVRHYHNHHEEWRWIRTVSHPVQTQDGQDTYFNGLIIDVTEQKQSELALQQINQLLEQRVAERTIEVEHRRRVAESLRGVLAVINSGQDLAHILDHIVSIANDLMEADASAVVRFDLNKSYAFTEASCGFPPDLPVSGYPLFQHGSQRTDASAVKRQPLMVEQFDREQLRAELERADIDPELKAWRLRALDIYSAYLALPLVVQDEVFGSLLFYYKHPQAFTTERVQVAMSLAEQVALAIENAYLHQQIQEAAAAEERNRLARDLHDAVSQTLFSASLIAEVLPALWEQNKHEGWRRLEELRQLTRGAQAEMRTLLHELRPQGLVESSLPDLLRQLAEAMQGRMRIPVTLSSDHACGCPVDVKLTFYRIAQEALNNMAKHAYATRVSVTLRCQGHGLTLTVSDDGRGFVPADIQGEHYGLTIMAERAAAIGAVLEVDSAPREGTIIRLSWLPESEDDHEYTDSGTDC